MTEIKVSNVYYSYGENENYVLSDLNLRFPSGRVTTLLGPNGSGKTTLLKIMLGFITPQRGSVAIDRRELSSYSRSRLSKLVAWVPQDEELSFPYTVRDYLLMGRSPHLGFLEAPGMQDQLIVNKVLKELDIPMMFLERELTQLSGGERRLILIARALVQEPQALILDEPTAHLDLGNKSRALQVIMEMSKAGRTMVFSSHDPNEALLIAEHVVILNEGRVVTQGTPEDVITESLLKEVYGVNVRIFRENGRVSVDLDLNG